MVSNSNDKEEEYKEKIIHRFGYNSYLRLLQSLAYIAENSKFNTADFLAGMVAGTWIRSVLPPSHEGYLVEDLDMIILYSIDDRLGSFKLIEIKHTDINSNNNSNKSNESSVSPLSLHHRREPLYFDFEPPSREVIGGNIPFYRLRKAQELTFGLMDHILKKSNRYEGFYILRFDNMMVEDAKIITVNNIPLSRDELKDFLIGRKHIEPYSFDFERYGMSYIV